MSRQNAVDRTAEADERLSDKTRDRRGGLGIQDQISRLRQFEQQDPGPQTIGGRPRWLDWENPGLRRAVKSAVAIAVVAVLGWTPLQRLISITSAEAIVNSRVITLRSPIEGRIAGWTGNSVVGSPLEPGEFVLRIENHRADRSRLDDLRRRRDELTDQRRTTAERIRRFERLRAEHLMQFSAFTRGRIGQIEARRNEAVADREAVKAKLAVSEATLDRIATLFARGVQTRQALDEATRENKVLQSALTASDRRIDAIEVELAAAREGIFVADGYNDVPRSAQRASELDQTIGDLQLTLAEHDRRLDAMQSEILEEARRYEATSVAVMTSPSAGHVWEVLTAPGEDVHRGQNLLRILDCRQTVVTAAVSEANFNKLRIGGNATFRLRGETGDLPGRVVGLYGLASVPANLAINHAMLSREPYHAAVEVPDLAVGPDCRIGRTGIVTFAGETVAP